ncbi:MAG: hypothetical protein EXR75_03535 [Myxococcales bacterium]|nr:hypothetical protein [Myxococcales bacterium]
MSEFPTDDFVHDAAAFVPAARPSSIGISAGEASYAELFAEVAWDGLITAEKRQQLRNAATIFQLDLERTRQIELALTAAHHAGVIEDTSTHEEDVTFGDAPNRLTIEPLGPADEPRLALFERRIAVLEAENHALVVEGERRADLNRRLEALVAQLQHALEVTMEDLTRANERVRDSARQLRDATRTSVPPELISTRDFDAPRVSTPPPLPAAAMSPRPQPAAPRPDAVTKPAAQHAIATPPVATPQPAVPAGQIRSRRLIHESTTLRAHAAAERGEPLREANADGGHGAIVAPDRASPEDVHRLVCRAPREPELLRALYKSLKPSQDIDRRVSVAHVLRYLGAANDEERALYEAYRQPGLVKPKRSVTDQEWRELLFHADEDPLTGELFAEIAPAMLLGHMTTLRASISCESVVPQQRIDARNSTVQAVRCFAWAADLLALEVPAVYACPDLDVSADIVLSPTPSTRLGKRALVGRSVAELAFLAGQHLTYYRKEHLLAKPTRSKRRLEDMLLAALSLGNPGLPLAEEIKRRIEPVVATLQPLLGKDGIKRLEKCFALFVEQGGRANLGRWLQSVELTAARAGMLLCNDLHAAESLLRLDEPEGVDAKLDSLIGYVTSPAYTTLRQRIGIAL